MKNKGMIISGVAAAALAAIAVAMSSNSKNSAPQLNGKALVPALDITEVAEIDIGENLKLVAKDKEWTISTMNNYPADKSKILDNILKLKDLKIGQVSRGKTLREKTPVVLKDASGKTIASVTLGERHEKWNMGRYADYNGTTVLVSDALDAFNGDGMKWCETKIVDTPWISFEKLVLDTSKDADFGFTTGIVKNVTVAGDTNRVLTIGNKVENGSSRYVKLDKSDWVYIVPEYSVKSLLPEEKKPEEKKADGEKKDAVKAADGEKKDETKAADGETKSDSGK